MKPFPDLALGLIALGAGYALMAFAYDEPAWYHQLAGLSGAVLFLAPLVWLGKGVVAFLRKGRDLQGSPVLRCAGIAFANETTFQTQWMNDPIISLFLLILLSLPRAQHSVVHPFR